MKKKIRLDILRRKFYEKNEKRKMYLKAIINEEKIPKRIRLEAKKRLRIKYKSSLTRIRNRSTFSQKARGVIKQYGLARITLIENVKNIPGINKW